MKKNLYINDYSLVDGNKIVRGHKTEYNLEEFLVGGLEKIKVLTMHIALTEKQADVLIDCMIDEHFAFGGDMKGFEDFVEKIGCFLDYYVDRLPQTIELPNEDTVPDTEESISNLKEGVPFNQIVELVAGAESQPF